MDLAVWLPVYATSLIHAADQARPTRAADPTQRSVGWPLVAAYTPLAAWAPLLLRRRWWAAQHALLVAAAGAEWARRRVDDAAAAPADPAAGAGNPARADAVLRAGTGMLAAWTAAASLVNLGSMLAAGWPVPGGRRARSTGVLLTAAVGALTSTVIRTSRAGSPTRGPYAATVVWALAGIAAGHRRTAPELTVTALAAILPVAAQVLRPPAPHRPGPVQLPRAALTTALASSWTFARWSGPWKDSA